MESDGESGAHFEEGSTLRSSDAHRENIQASVGGSHTKEVAKYFLFGVTYQILWPLVLVTLSGVGAIWYHLKAGHRGELSYRPFSPGQVVLGFLVGFYLNHAFDRNQKALEAVMTMSSSLQSFAHSLTNFVYDTYIFRGEHHLTDDAREGIRHDVNEAVALCKYYFLSCCTDLNVASVMKEGANDSAAAGVIQKWQTIGRDYVSLTPLASAQVNALMKHFQSSMHFDLMAQQWILEAVLRLAPSADKYKIGDDETAETHEAKQTLRQSEAVWAEARAQMKAELTAARNEFLKAHKIAYGRTSPVHFWLLGLLMFVLCLCMPWVIVADYGYYCLIPSLFLTYIFFGARQIGSDFWEPFGMDAAGLVDVDLERTCTATCNSIDQMIPFFRTVKELKSKFEDKSARTPRHTPLMRSR